MTSEAVVGLEVHAQLATGSKMFCRCATRFGDPPNTNVCPVCLGLPGALPVPNRAAVQLGVRVALALDCELHNASAFARKHYFYPDLPKGYQITQYDQPLATHGALALDGPEGRTVGIRRVHLEEDAGKSIHAGGKTAVDFNRCGVPLVEIVTAPDLRSGAEARRVLAALKQLLAYLDVSDCNMEAGNLRADANVSVRRSGGSPGVKQEIKNMNSLGAVERAVEALRSRQLAVLRKGGTMRPATFSAATGSLEPMRTKEAVSDYRYFPDPDLPVLDLRRAGIDAEAERRRLPELPGARRARLRRRYGLGAEEASVLTADRRVADYYEAVVGHGADPRDAAHWVMGPVLSVWKRAGAPSVRPERVARLLSLMANGVLSRQAARRVFEVVAERDQSPERAAEALGVFQVTDRDRLGGWIDEVLAEHPAAVARYRDGEAKLFDFFIGRVMRRSEGRADPKRVRRLLEDRLG